MIRFEIIFRTFEVRTMISTFCGMSLAAKTRPLLIQDQLVLSNRCGGLEGLLLHVCRFFPRRGVKARFSKGCDLDEKET